MVYLLALNFRSEFKNNYKPNDRQIFFRNMLIFDKRHIIFSLKASRNSTKFESAKFCRAYLIFKPPQKYQILIFSHIFIILWSSLVKLFYQPYSSLCSNDNLCPEGSDEEQLCPYGKTCAGNAESDCLAGSYCPEGSTIENCAEGSYCETGTRFPTLCDPGTFSGAESGVFIFILAKLLKFTN